MPTSGRIAANGFPSRSQSDAKNVRLFPALIALAVCLVGSIPGHAQGISGGMSTSSAQSVTQAGASLRVVILDENKKPLKQQAVVRLTNQSTGRVLFETSRGSETTFPDLAVATYLLEVGAAGYLGSRTGLTVSNVSYNGTQTITLARDPAAVDLTLKDAGQLPSKARKEAEKGIQALELSSFAEARKHLDAANRQYASSSSINFLLGYLARQQKEPDHELEYLTTAVKLDPKNLAAQNLLAQFYYDRADYAHAAEAAQIVVAGSPDSLVARKVLASSCLQLKQYEKARDNAQWIADHGGSEGGFGLLMLGQALIGLHQYDDAIQAFKTYLAGDTEPLSAMKVREALAKLEKALAQQGGEVNPNMGLGGSAVKADSDSLESNAGMPADVDAQRPSVAAGVACPADILQTIENPSQELVNSVAQFSAIEHMVHENITAEGTPTNRETRQYNYIVSISEPSEGWIKVDEYRDSGELDMPSKITTNGLAILGIAFHPLFRDTFDLSCEGLGDWNGQPAWLVHFRQLDNRPNRLRSYVVNKTYYPVYLKGRAWIRTDNFQVVHMETDLLRPIPEIHLMTEHTSVSYAPVEFRKYGTELWLPKSAELYVHFAKRRFHRSESFDHFMLFATETTEKPKLPNIGSAQPPATDHGPLPRQ